MIYLGNLINNWHYVGFESISTILHLNEIQTPIHSPTFYPNFYVLAHCLNASTNTPLLRGPIVCCHLLTAPILYLGRNNQILTASDELYLQTSV